MKPTHGEMVALLLSRIPGAADAEAARFVDAQIQQGHNHKWVIFGAGERGRSLAEKMRESNTVVDALVDNNPAIQGTMISGFPVLSLETVMAMFGDSAVYIITVATRKSGGEIEEQLMRAGIHRIVWDWEYQQWDKRLPVFTPVTLPSRTLAQKDEVQKAMDIWADDASKEEYLVQVRYRLQPWDFDMPTPSPRKDIYFPSDLFELRDEVFVDCGAFDGDTIRDLQSRCKPKHIVAIEANPESHDKLIKWYNGCEERNIDCRRLCVGLSRGMVKMILNGTSTCVDPTGTKGTAEVLCLPIDDIAMMYPPTFIKMDIEGAEYDAVKGATWTIKSRKPIVAACLYHNHEHLWKVPLLLKSLYPEYHLFLRRYEDRCWETIVYAIPPHRLIKKDVQ